MLLAFLAGGVGARYRGFQRHHALGARLGLAVAGQPEHGGDVVLVLLAQLLHARAVVEVVGAVRHAQAALQQVDVVAARIGQALVDPHPEQVLGVVIGHVQWIHVCAQGLAQSAHQAGAVLDRIDFRQHRLDRCQSLALDGGFVHVGAVEVGDLARFALERLVGHELFDQLDHAFVVRLGQRAHRAPRPLVGRDLGVGQPLAVGPAKEVVARLHRRARGLRVVMPVLPRRVGGRDGEGGAAQRQGDCGLDRCPAGFHVVPSV